MCGLGRSPAVEAGSSDPTPLTFCPYPVLRPFAPPSALASRLEAGAGVLDDQFTPELVERRCRVSRGERRPPAAEPARRLEDACARGGSGRSADAALTSGTPDLAPRRRHGFRRPSRPCRPRPCDARPAGFRSSRCFVKRGQPRIPHLRPPLRRRRIQQDPQWTDSGETAAEIGIAGGGNGWNPLSSTRMLEPCLNILPEAERLLWDRLGEIPSGFVLYGGTALALRLGHRQSAGFEFFSSDPLDGRKLLRKIPYLGNPLRLHEGGNTLTCVLEGNLGVTFLGGLGISRIENPEPAKGPGIPVASVIDIAASKVRAVQARPAAKDYVDIDAILRRGISLDSVLGAARAVFGPSFSPLATLKALAFYGDGNLGTLPASVRSRLTRAVGTVDVERLPVFRPRKDSALQTKPVRDPAMDPDRPEQALLDAASRAVWFQPPEKTLEDPEFFLCHFMAHGGEADLPAVRRAFSDDDFRHALANAPPGTIDTKSWFYWHIALGITPVPKQKIRSFMTEEELAALAFPGFFYDLPDSVYG